MTTTAIVECLFCDRICPRCGYEISGNWEHVEQSQAPESNVAVCSSKRVQRPLAEILELFFDHARHPQAIAKTARQLADEAAAVIIGLFYVWGWR